MKRPLILSLLTFALLAGAYFYAPSSAQREAIDSYNNTELITFQGVAMTMPYRISVPTPLTPAQHAACEKAILKAFHRIDTIFNHWNPRSQISAFNSLKQKDPIPVEPDLYQLFERIDQIWNLSDRLYDPTIKPLSTLWKAYLQKGERPPVPLQEQLQASSGWNLVELIPPNKVRKLQSDLQIDLNSIAKGYAVDLIMRNLKEIGLTHLFVEWGGELRVSGGHPTKRPWVVGIKTPRKSDYRCLAKVELNDGAIASSGHDELYWLIEDEQGVHTYSHLIDPRTHTPLCVEQRLIQTCTVIAPNCIDADALATAGMLYDSTEEAKQWAEHVIQRWPQVSIFFFTRNQELWQYCGSESIVKNSQVVELFQPAQNQAGKELRS